MVNLDRDGAVEVVGKSLVMPAQPPTERHAMFLPCLDILWKHLYYNERLMFYESSGVQDAGRQGVNIMEKLKDSLALCLVHYHPWCGRIAVGVDERLVIDCNNAGVEFVEASINMPIADLAKQGYQMQPFFEKLCQHIDHRGDCLFSSPLLSIQATLFSDGGLALGISQSHIVADGQSLWNFMMSWGECSRGLSLTLPPLHNRERLAVPDPSPEKANWSFSEVMKEDEEEEEDQKELGVVDNGDARTPKDGDKDNTIGMDPLVEQNKASTTIMETEPSANGDSASNGKTDASEKAKLELEPEPEPLVQCMFNLSSSVIKELKSDAGGIHTSFEVTCAHFWKRVAIARQRPTSERTFFAVLGNCRSRLTPPLPSAYFGNVIGFGGTATKAGKICRESLHATANRIHEAVGRIQEDNVLRFMHWLEAHNNDVSKAASANASKPKGKGLNVASSPRFPVYQVDFGWGKPAAVRAVKVKGDGEIVFFGGCPGSTQGDVEICMALPGSVMRRLLQDPEFLAKPPCSPFVS